MSRIRDFFRADGGVPLKGVTSMPGVPKPVPVAGLEDGATYRPARQSEPSYTGSTWAQVQPLGHMCAPPNVYPPGWGPGSMYVCPNCSLVWEAVGVMVRSDGYRPLVDGTKMLFGAKRWLCADADADGLVDRTTGSKPADIAVQEGIYDWRDASEALCERLDEIKNLLQMVLNPRIMLPAEGTKIEGQEFEVRDGYIVPVHDPAPTTRMAMEPKKDGE